MVGKDSQGDCIYYNPDIVKTGIFQIIMENKYSTSIFQTLSQTTGTNEEFIYINTHKLQCLQAPPFVARTKWRNKIFFDKRVRGG